jgi:hypothetical protein
MKMADTLSWNRIKGNELVDLLENTGIMQELNRTVLNPLGLHLAINSALELELSKTDNPEGVVLHTVDRFRLQIYNKYRYEKHQIRQQKLGYIIQTNDMIRKEKLAENKNLNLSSTQNLKLKTLLTCIDTAAYEVKKRFMENSPNKDEELDIPFGEVYKGMEFDLAQGNFIDAISKLILINYQESIEVELVKIKKTKEEQDKAFKRGGK